MSDISVNIPNVKLSDIIKEVTSLFANAIKKNIPFKTIPTIFLWGAPGVGKSQGVGQIAENLRNLTGKDIVVTDIRLLLFSPIDLRGVPVADVNREFTDWLKPRIFDMNKDENTVNILFLDELSAVPQSIQAAAYQICLDRKIGEHCFPDNCIVIAAGNRTTDQSVSYKMPKALANRLMHINVASSYEAWREWAVQHDIDSRIIAYLDFDNSRLCVEPEASDLAYPTPRSWEFVSNIIKTAAVNSDPQTVNMFIAGLIGNDATFEFEAFCNNYLKMPSVEAIRKGKCLDFPKAADVLYALISALVDVVKNDSLNETEIDNICNYIYRFPKDYIMVFVRDVTTNSAAKAKISKNHSFQKLVAKI